MNRREDEGAIKLREGRGRLNTEDGGGVKEVVFVAAGKPASNATVHGSGEETVGIKGGGVEGCKGRGVKGGDGWRIEHLDVDEEIRQGAETHPVGLACTSEDGVTQCETIGMNTVEEPGELVAA